MSTALHIFCHEIGLKSSKTRSPCCYWFLVISVFRQYSPKFLPGQNTQIRFISSFLHTHAVTPCGGHTLKLLGLSRKPPVTSSPQCMAGPQWALVVKGGFFNHFSSHLRSRKTCFSNSVKPHIIVTPFAFTYPRTRCQETPLACGFQAPPPQLLAQLRVCCRVTWTNSLPPHVLSQRHCPTARPKP